MFKKLIISVKIILVMQAICMLIGTSTHALWVMRHGWTYVDLNPHFSIYTTIFWNSLTFLDPLAAILLFVKPKAGVLLTATIIIVDVLHNAWVSNQVLPFAQTTLHDWLLKNQFLILQSIFCIFVLSTLKMNLGEINAKFESRIGRDENLKMGQAVTLSDSILSYSKSKKIFLKIKKSIFKLFYFQTSLMVFSNFQITSFSN